MAHPWSNRGPQGRGIRFLAFVLVAFAATPALADPELATELKSHVDSLPDARTRAEYLEGLAADHADDAAFQFELGNAYYDLSQFEKAVEHLSRATELDPSYLAARVNLGSVYDEMGRLEDALEAYRAALELNPTEEKTLCNIGGVYFQKRQIQLALDHFNQAIEHNADSQLAHYNLAILFADAEIYDEAVNEWQRVVDIDPDSDLGQRSRDNIGIIRQMEEMEVPTLEDEADHSHDH